MEECNICLTKKKRNKNKHERSKKHKYIFSNLIINKYVIKLGKSINLLMSSNHNMMSIERNLIVLEKILFRRKTM